jgi:hypothetical protein
MPLPTINQGKYQWELANLMEGEIPNQGVLIEKLTGLNMSTVIIPFGRGIVRDASANGQNEKNRVRLPGAAGEVIRGVALFTGSIANIPGVSVTAAGDLGYPARGADGFKLMTYVTRGVIAVKAIEAVVYGDPVTCVITAGANQGVFGKTANASQIACPTSWEWVKPAAAGEIGHIHLK